MKAPTNKSLKAYDQNMNKSAWRPAHYICDDDASGSVTVLSNTGTMTAHSAVQATTAALLSMQRRRPAAWYLMQASALVERISK